MKNTTTLIAMILFSAVSGTTWAAGGPPQKCNGSDIANGPFSYIALGVVQASFNGTGGSSVDTNFSIQAPNPNPDTDASNVFPGQGGEHECAQTAIADIGVLEIEKVADASGTPLSPSVTIDPSSSLGQAIKGAFTVSPDVHEFVPGESTTVSVAVNNPSVDTEDYGSYAIKLAAKADGYGIGVGPGIAFTLVLAAPTISDTTPPVVNVTKPAGDEILGLTGIEVKAYDPDNPGATGLASLSATVSSAGGSVSNLPIIDFTLDTTLPAPPGNTVTGTGSFTPVGGTGPAGTTDALAFTSASRSGIGSYTVTASAVDVAGNPASAAKSFAVNYAVAFTKQSSASSTVCTTSSTSPGRANCQGQFEFTVNRSDITSDGAFMFDHTVEVDLVRSDNTVMATHSYGTGGINTVTQIDATNLVYKTNFKRGDLYSTLPNTPSSYMAKIYFKDVDGNRVLQGTSISVNF